jgi:hypothetical protein
MLGVGVGTGQVAGDWAQAAPPGHKRQRANKTVIETEDGQNLDNVRTFIRGSFSNRCDEKWCIEPEQQKPGKLCRTM